MNGDRVCRDIKSAERMREALEAEALKRAHRCSHPRPPMALPQGYRCPRCLCYIAAWPERPDTSGSAE